jgi:signal transduction histidine kinase
LTLYRVVQQALANVHKHAKTDKARVFLSNKDNGIQLIIEDEGIGFDTNGKLGRGIGLSSMRERVMALEGKWELFSEPGAGTSIRAWVPNPPKVQ